MVVCVLCGIVNLFAREKTCVAEAWRHGMKAAPWLTDTVYHHWGGQGDRQQFLITHGG